MRWGFAALAWLALAAPALGQDPLAVTAALNEAVSFNPELLAMRRGPAGERSPLRAAAILAEVRTAHAELAIARNAVALYEGLLPMLTDMAVAAARSGAGEMGRHDSTAAAVDMARVAVSRSAAQQQVKLAELRLNAALGRRLDAPVEALAMRDVTDGPPEAVEIALARDQRLAAASPAQRDIVALDVRRKVLEARARVDGARERAVIMTSTVMPQAQLGFDGARAAYAAGQSTYLEMMDAHHRQLEARVEYVTIYADYERALVALDIAMGETPERLALATGAAAREP